MINKIRNLVILTITLFCGSLVSCDDDNGNVDLYKEWRELNEKWLVEQTLLTQEDGSPFYTRIGMPTDPQAYILMHSIGEVNDENLKPLFTSVTKVNYTVTLANDSVVDKGTDFVTQLNSSSLITGWGLAIMQLHVGDSAQFVLPANMAYGSIGAGTILPYSNLQFNIRLVSIPNYETKP